MGWSIMLVLLDLTGGVFSSGQMIVDAYNFEDWTSFYGNPTKFGIALVTYIFDFIFILQHYVCYKNARKEETKRNEGYHKIPQDEPSQLGLIG